MLKIKNDKLTDKKVIQFFISHLSKTIGRELTIKSFPDELNRNSRDIDAVAGEYAIEHTSIDRIENQRRDFNYFLQAIGLIESELKDKINFQIDITIPYSAIQVGQDWTDIRISLTSWILDVAPSLHDGVHIINDDAILPFKFYADKSSDQQISGVYFARFSSVDNTLTSRIGIQLSSKAVKLSKYKQDNYTTILLVESDDPALMNKFIFLKAIKDAFKNKLPENVDDIWFVKTYCGEIISFANLTEEIKVTVYNK